MVGELRFSVPDRRPFLDEARVVFPERIAPHAIRVDLEEIVVALVVEAVDRDPEAIVGRKYPPLYHLRGPDGRRLAVNQVGRDVEILVVVGDANDRLFRRRCAVGRRRLMKVVHDSRRRPNLVVQPAIDHGCDTRPRDFEGLSFSVDRVNGGRIVRHEQESRAKQIFPFPCHLVSPRALMQCPLEVPDEQSVAALSTKRAAGATRRFGSEQALDACGQPVQVVLVLAAQLEFRDIAQ